MSLKIGQKVRGRLVAVLILSIAIVSSSYCLSTGRYGRAKGNSRRRTMPMYGQMLPL